MLQSTSCHYQRYLLWTLLETKPWLILHTTDFAIVCRQIQLKALSAPFEIQTWKGASCRHYDRTQLTAKYCRTSGSKLHKKKIFSVSRSYWFSVSSFMLMWTNYPHIAKISFVKYEGIIEKKFKCIINFFLLEQNN